MVLTSLSQVLSIVSSPGCSSFNITPPHPPGCATHKIGSGLGIGLFATSYNDHYTENKHAHTLSLVSVTVDTVLGVATVEVEVEAEDEVNVDRLVDDPRLSSRALPSVPSP